MSLIFRITNFIKHKLTAGDEHSIHSPFVYSLYTGAIKKNKQFYCFQAIENLRKKAESNASTITVQDFGAGSTIFKNNERKIADIAKIHTKNQRQSQLLFCLAWFLKPKTILDLGTSLGLTTAYLASADKKANVITFEGCPQTATIAEKNFKSLKLNNIKQVTGNIDKTLNAEIANLNKIDFVFFDANHQYTPTLKYFNSILPKIHEGTVFVFDDLYWSSDMKKAWEEIIHHPSVTISIDLYHLGIVFFRKNAPKQHFNLKIK